MGSFDAYGKKGFLGQGVFLTSGFYIFRAIKLFADPK